MPETETLHVPHTHTSLPPFQNCVESIRENYRKDFQSKEMMVRQRAVALYFIDKLALRAGNEKDDDEADTVGCCSLRVEHISELSNKSESSISIPRDNGNSFQCF